MLKKEWNYYASKARKIAKHIKTGAEENRDVTRRSKIIDIQDINATDALNKKFAEDGSRASVHTYWGGKQEIATIHADGSKCIFQTNCECQPTNNPMDIEVAKYINIR